MASNQKKESMAALDKANKEYKQVCYVLKSKYKELDKASDNALVLISDVENLVERASVIVRGHLKQLRIKSRLKRKSLSKPRT